MTKRRLNQCYTGDDLVRDLEIRAGQRAIERTEAKSKTRRARDCHPAILAFHDPKTKLTGVPWPHGFSVEVDGDSWMPARPGFTENDCPQCRGNHTVAGGEAQYCPWCGHELNLNEARHYPNLILWDRPE